MNSSVRSINLEAVASKSNSRVGSFGHRQKGKRIISNPPSRQTHHEDAIYSPIKAVITNERKKSLERVAMENLLTQATARVIKQNEGFSDPNRNSITESVQSKIYHPVTLNNNETVIQLIQNQNRLMKKLETLGYILLFFVAIIFVLVITLLFKIPES